MSNPADRNLKTGIIPDTVHSDVGDLEDQTQKCERMCHCGTVCPNYKYLYLYLTNFVAENITVHVWELQ